MHAVRNGVRGCASVANIAALVGTAIKNAFGTFARSVACAVSVRKKIFCGGRCVFTVDFFDGRRAYRVVSTFSDDRHGTLRRRDIRRRMGNRERIVSCAAVSLPKKGSLPLRIGL